MNENNNNMSKANIDDNNTVDNNAIDTPEHTDDVSASKPVPTWLMMIYAVLSIIIFPIGLVMAFMWWRSKDKSHRTASRVSLISGIVGVLLMAGLVTWSIVGHNAGTPMNTVTSGSSASTTLSQEQIKQTNDVNKQLYEYTTSEQGTASVKDAVSIVDGFEAAHATFDKTGARSNMMTVYIKVPMDTSTDATRALADAEAGAMHAWAVDHAGDINVADGSTGRVFILSDTEGTQFSHLGQVITRATADFQLK